MLILARYVNEAIMIGDEIQIRLVTIDNDRALIGISAPKNIEVHRQEIYDRNKNLIRNIFRSSKFPQRISLNGKSVP